LYRDDHNCPLKSICFGTLTLLKKRLNLTVPRRQIHDSLPTHRIGGATSKKGDHPKMWEGETVLTPKK